MTVFVSDALKGKHALITGATGGVGQAIAKRVAELGAAVTITGRNSEKLDALQRELTLPASANSANIHAVTADLTAEADREHLVEEAERRNGPVSLFVNNAGAYSFGMIEQITEETLEQIMRINFTSAVLLSQLVYRGMKSRRAGSVVNIASLSGLRGRAGHLAYSASKFALIGFTHCFALEAIKHNVRVNAVCPGNVDTEMGHIVVQNFAAAKGITYDQQIGQMQKDIPSGRITTPEEVAETVAFLLTDAAGNIVGESIKISGGTLL